MEVVAGHKHTQKWSWQIGTDLIEFEESDCPLSLGNTTLATHCTQWQFSYLELSAVPWTAVSIKDTSWAEGDTEKCHHEF